jgi:hypothetical protein
MAHTPGGAQLFFVNYGTHKFIGVQAAFHQRLDLAVARKHDSLCSSGVTVLGGH